MGARARRVSHLRAGARVDVRRHLVELIIVILSAIVIGALAFGREAARNALPHSTYSSNDTGPNGYRALYEMLHSAGVPVTRFSRVLGVLDSHVGTLVLATYAPDPDPQPMGASDTALLKDFVERGGRLVVLDYDFEEATILSPVSPKAPRRKQPMRFHSRAIHTPTAFARSRGRSKASFHLRRGSAYRCSRTIPASWRSRIPSAKAP